MGGSQRESRGEEGCKAAAVEGGRGGGALMRRAYSGGAAELDLITGDSLAKPINQRTPGWRRRAAAPRSRTNSRAAAKIASALEGGYKYAALRYAFSAAAGLMEEVSPMMIIHSGR